jgi:hypothetical protein
LLVTSLVLSGTPVLAQLLPPVSAPAGAAAGASPLPPQAGGASAPEPIVPERAGPGAPAEEGAAAPGDSTAPAAAVSPQPRAAGPPVAGAELVPETEDPALEEALAALTSAEGQLTDEGLRIYGFADVNFLYLPFASADNASDAQWWERRSAFFVGHVHLYLDRTIRDRLRSQIEVRFLYEPAGSVPIGPPAVPEDARTDTAVREADVPTRLMTWGGISLQRALIQYEFHRLLTVRAGHWITPFSVWLVDHSSTVVIPAFVPFVVADALMPLSQFGVQLSGDLDLRDALSLRYYLTISNGRTPFPNLDFDRNKGVGGRLELTSTHRGQLRLGGSVYAGKFTDARLDLRSKVTGDLSNLDEIAARADELVFAADAVWDWHRLRLQSEIIVNQTRFDDDARSLNPSGLSFASDGTRWGSYFLAAYRTRWLHTAPFVTLHYYSPVGLKAGSLGLNVRPFPELALKLEYVRGEGTQLNDSALEVLSSQVSWAF